MSSLTAFSEDQLLALAAAVERESEHPLAQAVARRADDAGVARLVATAFRNVPGHGAQAEVDGQRVLVGNRRLMATEGIDPGAWVTTARAAHRTRHGPSNVGSADRARP